MKFSIYDLLSNIIPGFLIIFAASLQYEYSVSSSDVTILIILSYVVGYLNNTISSWSEGILDWSWGGKPSDQVLSGKNIWKVKFYDIEKVNEYLTNESQNSSPSLDHLFQIAMRNTMTSERVVEFNSNYAFARNLIISFLISFVIINIKYWFNMWIFILSLSVLVIIWLRAKQRGFYFAREVLNTYIKIKDKNIS